MPSRIHSVHIEGFRSLADIGFRPRPGVTVLLGANGAGKSNILRFFEMMRWMLREHRLARFVSAEGGADDQLFRGSAVTKRIAAAVNIREDEKPDRNLRYRFELAYAHPDRLVFANEEATYSWLDTNVHSSWGNSAGGYSEAELYFAANSERTEETSQCARTVVDLLGTSLVFQYHDTDRF
ncbi:MAG: AAA family ATPase, partial [Rhodospirillaceae bacterium]|nr:AAA family ATPase [Rhodospirillaceae bacterium]